MSKSQYSADELKSAGQSTARRRKASAPTFNGRRVLTFESRRAKEMASLIQTFGGQPIVAPAMRELPMDSDEETRNFAAAVIRGDYDAVIFLTGVGVKALVDVVDRSQQRAAFLSALGRTRVITRGPKPVAVLRELKVSVWLNAAEPNTWREVLAALDARTVEWPLAGANVAVQEYGVSNTDLLEGLRVRGAHVHAIQPYRWDLPEDVAPLREAAQAVARGEVDVVLVTTGVQIVHFWRVVHEMGLDEDARRGMSAALIASIGPSASAEIRRHGFVPSFEPSHPRMGLLVREAAARFDRSADSS